MNAMLLLVALAGHLQAMEESARVVGGPDVMVTVVGREIRISYRLRAADVSAEQARALAELLLQHRPARIVIHDQEKAYFESVAALLAALRAGAAGRTEIVEGPPPTGSVGPDADHGPVLDAPTVAPTPRPDTP